MKRLALITLLLAFGAELARAAGPYIREDYFFGSYGYHANTVSVTAQTSKNTLLGGEYTFYKDNDLPDVVNAIKMPLFINNSPLFGFFRPFYYPSSKLVRTSAAGFNAYAILLLLNDNVQETRTQLALNMSLAAQKAAFNFADGNSSRKLLPEAVYEIQLQQNYLKEFYLVTSASFYQYLTGVNGVSFPDLVMDQGDVSSTGVTSALRELPLWNAGLEVNRSVGDGSDEQIYFQYHYISFAQDYQAAHALTMGTRFKLSEVNSFDFGYNWISRGQDGKQNYYRAAFRLSF